jgi:hypothetical protein
LVTASRGRASTRAIAPDDVGGVEAWQRTFRSTTGYDPFTVR